MMRLVSFLRRRCDWLYPKSPVAPLLIPSEFFSPSINAGRPQWTVVKRLRYNATTARTFSPFHKRRPHLTVKFFAARAYRRRFVPMPAHSRNAEDAGAGRKTSTLAKWGSACAECTKNKSKCNKPHVPLGTACERCVAVGPVQSHFLSD